MTEKTPSTPPSAAQWEWPVNTVGKLIASLQTLPPNTPFYTAYFVEIDGAKVARTRNPSLSYETTDGFRVLKYDEKDKSLVMWASQDKRDPVSETVTTWQPGEQRVVCAALKDAAGRIVTGARHFDVVMIEQIKRGPATDAWRSAEQGFIDQFGTFLTREEAMVIATKWGQIIRDDEGRQSLYSENLY